MEKNKQNNNSEEKKSHNQIPALLYISLGIIIYFSGRQLRSDVITLQTGIGILLLAVGFVKVILYFIRKNKSTKIEDVKGTINSKGSKKGKNRNK